MSWVDSCDDDYALDALKEEVADLKAENAELRELVERLYGSYCIEYPDAAEREFAGEMRGLGIEV